MDIKNKKISIIGAERSGIGAAKLAKKLGAIPFVSDMSSDNKLKAALQQLEEYNIDYETGIHSDKVFDCEFIVTSPGVPFDAEVLKKAKRKGIKIISELEFASIFCKGTVIAITGTNGKTTTTALCNHVLNNVGFKSYAAGNIGSAFSEIAFEIKPDEFVALEVSSFQLDYIKNFKPKFAVLLNITPDHLNRYENDFHKYMVSKARIFMNQDQNDFLIINNDDENIQSILNNNEVNSLKFSINEKVNFGSYISRNDIIFVDNNNNEEIVCSITDIKLKGEHNLLNTLPIIAIAKLLNVSDNKIKESLKTFNGVEHRLELVRILKGIKFINDSKATNINSVWYALKSFDEPILLILGGVDKGNDYNEIKELVINKVKKIFAIGSSANKIYEFFKNLIDVEIVGSLNECVIKAYKQAVNGDVVLLSPACASFDMFENFEDRGAQFKNAVMAIS